VPCLTWSLYLGMLLHAAMGFPVTRLWHVWTTPPPSAQLPADFEPVPKISRGREAREQELHGLRRGATHG